MKIVWIIAIRYLRHKPVAHTVFCTQLVLVSLLMMYSTVALGDLRGAYRTAKQFENVGHLYSIVDASSEENLVDVEFRRDDAVERLHTLLAWLRSSQLHTFMSVRHSPITEVRDPEGQQLVADTDQFACHVDISYVNRLPLEVSAGRSLAPADFRDREETPVLVGAGLSDQYEIGDVVYFPYETRGYAPHKVIGVLANGESALGNPRGFGIRDLRDSFVIPIVLAGHETGRETLGSLDMLLTNGIVITENPSGFLSGLRSVSERLRLYSFTLIDYDDAVQRQLELRWRGVWSIGLYCLAVLSFATFGITTTKCRSVIRRMNEFGIHLMSGAQVVQILAVIACESMIPVLVGMLFSLLISVTIVRSLFALVVTCLVLMVVGAGVAIPPVMTLRNASVSRLLRRRE